MTDLSITDPDVSPSDVDEYYRAYEEHSKTLRAWLVAYGIGAPVLLLTSDAVAAAIAASAQAGMITRLFLAGVGLQVGLAALNKTVMWCCYHAERNPEVGTQWPFRASYWISKQFWIDLGVDVACLVLFSIASYQAFNVILPGA